MIVVVVIIYSLSLFLVVLAEISSSQSLQCFGILGENDVGTQLFRVIESGDDNGIVCVCKMPKTKQIKIGRRKLIFQLMNFELILNLGFF